MDRETKSNKGSISCFLHVYCEQCMYIYLGLYEAGLNGYRISGLKYLIGQICRYQGTVLISTKGPIRCFLHIYCERCMYIYLGLQEVGFNGYWISGLKYPTGQICRYQEQGKYLYMSCICYCNHNIFTFINLVSI